GLAQGLISRSHVSGATSSKAGVLAAAQIRTGTAEHRHRTTISSKWRPGAARSGLEAGLVDAVLVDLVADDPFGRVEQAGGAPAGLPRALLSASRIMSFS